MAIYALDASDLFDVNESEMDVINPDPDVSYTIRPLTMTDIRSYRKQATVSVINKKTHQREDEFDADRFQDLMIDHALVAWTGILFKSSNEPVPCTTNYKVQGLDLSRRKAILDLAGANQSSAKEEQRKDSFRATP